MLVLEALRARFGDALVLHSGTKAKPQLTVIDGGPPGVYGDALRPRLEALREERGLGAATPLDVDLMMVSHIDDDHINGIQKLTNALIGASPAKPAAVKFARFWFNSFDDLVGPKPQGLAGDAATASLQSLVDDVLPHVDDHHAELIMQSVGQGVSLASDLGTLNLKGNRPVNGLVVAKKGQKAFDIEGANVTVIGPMQNRIDKLRAEWAKALAKPSKDDRKAAMQELFLPDKSLDKSVPNLSSIVVLVDVGGRKLLLTGDAFGDDIVTAWGELELGAAPVKIDLLKMPHHGSIRNATKKFFEFFQADHYVFSANGKFDNPDPPTVEAMVKIHGARNMTLHFTNADVTWSNPYTLEKDGTTVRNLGELIPALKKAYGGLWSANMRKPADKSVVVQLA